MCLGEAVKDWLALWLREPLLVIDGGKQWPRKSQTVGTLRHFSEAVKVFLAVDLLLQLCLAQTGKTVFLEQPIRKEERSQYGLFFFF